MQRTQDWPERLAALIESRIAEPFAWGTNDCTLFAADAILAMTGTDPVAPFRGKYRNRNQAERFTLGDIETFIETIFQQNGFPEIPVSRTQRGDIVLCAGPTGQSVAVVSMRGLDALTPGDDGLMSIPLSVCTRAWRI